jgi:hypothetical protein
VSPIKEEGGWALSATEEIGEGEGVLTVPLKLTLCSLTLRLVKTKRGLLKEYVHTSRAGEGAGLLGAGADGGLPARGKRSLHISDKGFKTRLHLPLTSSSPRVVCLRH